jgi:hypothetical protein
MRNVKKYAAIAAVSAGVAFGAASPASACGSAGGLRRRLRLAATAAGAAAGVAGTAMHMATAVTLWHTRLGTRVTPMRRTPHGITGSPTLGPAITSSFMRPRTACDIA